MKRFIIMFMLLVLCISSSAELDYDLVSEFGFGGVRPLHYSNGKILAGNSYGYTIYEIQEDGTLEDVSNVELKQRSVFCYSHDKIGSFSRIDYFTSCFTIFDASAIDEQTPVWELDVNSEYDWSAEMFESYFILRTGEYEYTVYDIETFQPLNQVSDISLVYNSKFVDEGAILLDYTDNYYYYYVIDENGVLQRKYNLGEEERKVAIDGDKLLAYTATDINFYNITEFDELQLSGTLSLSEPLNLNGRVAYKNDRIVLPIVSKLYLYEVTDNISINLLDNVELSNRPYTEKPLHVNFIQNGIDLYAYTPHYLMHAYIDNDVIYFEDIGVSSIISLATGGLIKDDVYYVQSTQRNSSLKTYLLADLNDVQDVPHDYPDTSMYRFLEKDQKVGRYDELTGAVSLYDFSEDEMVLEAIYAPQPPFTQDWFSVVKWDGTHFIYQSLGSLYSFVYTDGEFVTTWSILNSDLLFYRYGYGVYENYLYEYKSGEGVFVYEFTEGSINQINYLTTPFNGGEWGLHIKDEILTVDNEIVDLSHDPTNLSHRYNLNQHWINGGSLKHDDYLLYCGYENVYENGVLVAIDLGLFIYNLIDDIPVKAGSIISGNGISSVQVIPSRIDDRFNLLVFEAGYYSIYSCHATPNGQLEITPVTLNAANYPNPFNPETTISYNIEQAGSVSIDVYNLKGQKVKTLVNEKQEAGKHSVIWQGDNDKGQQVSSGTYFYRVTSANQEIVKKMLLMK